jgi:ribosomal protein S18 acetylase RimI-like enzyme
MTTAIRAATPADFDELLIRTRALNAHEGIVVAPDVFEGALRQLLADPALGGAWLILDGDAIVGYAICTYGFDLEFGGRDCYMTELWIDPPHRGSGAGARAIELIVPELRARGVHAVHLQVRPENAAARLYARQGFAIVPRHVMSRRIL